MSRRPEVDTIISCLQGYVGELDRTVADNRRAAWTLIARAKKKCQEVGETQDETERIRTEYAVRGICNLIDAIFSGHPSMEFEAQNCTSFRYLVNNAQRISNRIRATRQAGGANGSKGNAVHEAIRRKYAGDVHDHPSGDRS